MSTSTFRTDFRAISKVIYDIYCISTQILNVCVLGDIIEYRYQYSLAKIVLKSGKKEKFRDFLLFKKCL